MFFNDFTPNIYNLIGAYICDSQCFLHQKTFQAIYTGADPRRFASMHVYIIFIVRNKLNIFRFYRRLFTGLLCEHRAICDVHIN